jgi:hypothetical protein
MGVDSFLKGEKCHIMELRFWEQRLRALLKKTTSTAEEDCELKKTTSTAEEDYGF